MPITAQTSFVEYAGNGTTTTGYTITFTYQDAADIDVYVDNLEISDFSITGGKVYTGSAIASTSEVRIENAVPYAQDLELVEGGDFSSILAQRAWDRSVLMIQQLRDAVGRCLRMKRGAAPGEMAEATNVYTYIDASGNLVARTAAQVAADVTPELDFTATGTKVTLTTADNASRALLAPDFTGQILTQLNTQDIYVSTGTGAGEWALVASAISIEAFAAIEELADLGQGAYTIYGGPVALKFGDLIYIGSINTDGTKSQRVLSWDVVNLAAGSKTVRTSNADDDHNNPFLAIRPDQSQIVAVSADHASGSSNDIHFFRSTGLAASTLPGTDTFTHAGTAPTYSHPYINPADLDQMDTITRYGASAQLDWRVLRSENMNGGPPTTTAYPLFINHYVKATVASDGSGLWLAATNEPLGTTSGPTATKPVFCPRIALWFLDWATDEISSGGVVEGTLTTPFTQVNGQSANELGYTNDISNAAWVKTGETSPSTSTLSNRWGATSVSIQKLVENGATGNHRARQLVTCDAGETYEFSAYVKMTAGEVLKCMIQGPVGCMASHGTDTTDPQIWVDMQDGSRFNATNNLDHWEITDVGNSWWRIGGVFTATDTVVGSYFHIFCLDDAGLSSYAGRSVGFYVDSMQYGVTPYTDRLMPFCQNITTSVRPSTAVPLVVYDPPEKKLCRLLAVKDVGEQVAFLFAEFDDHLGAKASDSARNVRILYREVNKATYALSSISVLSTSAVDGLDDDASTGSFTYLGGDIIDRMDVMFDQQNVDNAGTNRIVRAKSINGGSFTQWVIKESSGADQVMRPLAVQEVTFTGSDLRYGPSDWIAWMQGPYDGYTPARGDFDTDIHVAKLTS